MKEGEKVFLGHVGMFSLVNLELPIEGSEHSECSYFREGYLKAAKAAKEEGNEAAYHVYRFLEVLTSFNASFDTPNNPFTSWLQMAGKRT